MENFIELASLTTKRARKMVARLLVDTKTRKIYFIPNNINHPEFVMELLKVKKNFLKENPLVASRFVGVAVEIENEIVKRILVGISGLEMWLVRYKKPFHSKKQVNEASTIIIDYLLKETKLAKGYKLNTSYI